ncbi:methyl-accepting chemotaxis protein [Fusibacter tunisiensis]|uniref:Methyl-accepting chemotaxis protein n=1 Tax=Fusibacter tunisiensis TaxID=1008308 RepID=A0ABS2MPL9_9FIRM|nr:methyl-accepting chemotaxis protein [Fusibacter tunisiensis]MBM7561338.1 methyl-accepting chemotaxis protein [Fusibacter tunisiensis]
MKSIKGKLIVYFSLLVVVSLMAVGFTALMQTTSVITNDSTQSMSSLAHQSSLMTKSEIEKNSMVIELIGGRSDIKGMNWLAQKPILLRQLKLTEFKTLGVANLKGDVRYTDEREMNIAEEPYFKEALEGKPAISDVIINPLNDMPEVVFVAPIIDIDKVRGVLVAHLDARKLSDITDSVTYGEKGYAYMINSIGQTIAHPDRNRVNKLYNTLIEVESTPALASQAEAIQKMIDEKSGTYSYTYDGKPLMVSYEPVEGTPWIFVLQADESEVLGTLTAMQKQIFYMILLAVAVSVVIVYLVGNSIAKPLKELAGSSKKIAELDITTDIPEKLRKRKDEVGVLSTAYQTVIENLRGVISDIMSSADQVAASSQQLTASSQQASIAVEEVSRAVEEIASGATDQARNSEEGSEKGLELGRVIEEDQTQLSALNAVSEVVGSLVNEGLSEVEKLSSIADKSNAATHKVQSEIIKTDNSTQKIDQASQMIASIADQTNLLALNAAIEAARAGEAGRGFAVVAEEIRKLAEQSMSSTHTIDEVVKELQLNSHEAVVIMQDVLDVMKEQMESVDTTRRKYHEITEAIGKTRAAVEKLNVSGQDMEEMKNEIIDALQNLAAIAEENSASSEEVSASMQQQTSSMDEIASASESLAELAQGLKSAVMKFKI